MEQINETDSDFDEDETRNDSSLASGDFNEEEEEEEEEASSSIGDGEQEQEDLDSDLEEDGSDETEREGSSDMSESEGKPAEQSYDNIDEKIELTLDNPKNAFSSLSIDLSHTPTSLRCSPQDNVACVATVNGDVIFVKYDESSIECLAQVECYGEQSCVDIDFSKCGNTVYTVCGQHEVILVDVNSHQMYNFGNLSNDENTNLTNIKCINHWCFCTADDKGHVKVWDTRCIKPFKAASCLRRGSDEVNDYVSDMVVDEGGHRVATASGAGVVTVFDVRKLNIINQNRESKSDLTSLASISNGSEVVAGSLRGDLVFTSWQENQHKSHIFSALQHVACNSIKAFTENLIITSWDDNLIRLFGVYPHKFLGFIGQKTFPAEFLDIDSQKHYLLSCGFDKKLWLWNVQGLERKAKKLTAKPFLLEGNHFFSDL